MADESSLVISAREALHAALQRAHAPNVPYEAERAEILARVYANILDIERRRVSRVSKPDGLYSSTALDSSVAIKEIA